MQVAIWRQFTSVFCVWMMLVIPTMVGCGPADSGTPDSPIPRQNDNTKGIIDLPGVNLNGYKAKVGTSEPTEITGGAFTGELRSDAPGLLVVENANGVPILLNARPANSASARGARLCDISREEWSGCSPLTGWRWERPRAAAL